MILVLQTFQHINIKHVATLHFFSALMLLGGQQEGHLGHKKVCFKTAWDGNYCNRMAYEHKVPGTM